MISKAIHCYFKTRLISLNSELPAIMTEMTRVGFSQIDTALSYKDPMAYEQAVFLSSQRKRFDKILTSVQGAEKNELQKAVGRLDHFTALKDFLDYCKDVHKTVYVTWVKLASDISNGKLIMSQEVTDEADLKMVSYSIKRYEDLLEKAKDFPAWREKIVAETGYMVNFLHSIHANDVNLEELLKDFNKQEFFK
jgi:hypothetical protein